MKVFITLVLVFVIVQVSFPQTMFVHTNTGTSSFNISQIDSITFSALGPLAWWPLGEGSGSIAYDSSGHGYDGTLNGASWVPGGVQLSDETQSVDFADSVFRLSEGTWEVIVNVSAFNAVGSSSIVEKDDIGYGDHGRLLLSPEGNVQWIIDDATDQTSKEITSPDSIHLNTDTRITAQWGPNGMKLFINDKLVGSNDHPRGIVAEGMPLTIGSHFSGSRSMIGIVKDLKVYNENIP